MAWTTTLEDTPAHEALPRDPVALAVRYPADEVVIPQIDVSLRRVCPTVNGWLSHQARIGLPLQQTVTCFGGVGPPIGGPAAFGTFVSRADTAARPQPAYAIFRTDSGEIFPS